MSSDAGPDPVSGVWRLLLWAVARLPQAGLSRALGRLGDLPLPPPLRRPLLGLFARIVGIDASEAARPLEEYPTLNAFFSRALRPGLRTWPGDAEGIGSPVDGRLGACGEVRSGRLLQAKGRWYSAADLLGSPEAARAYDEGRFLTIYLSPRHYHRIHAPAPGRIGRARHLPGALLPVNPPAVHRIPDLFPRNERIAVELESEAGAVAVVAVGAFNVGWISTSFDPEWRPPPGEGDRRRPGDEAEIRRWDPPMAVEAGEEIMAFHLGSTVIVLFERDTVELTGELEAGREIRAGEAVARWTSDGVRADDADR